MTHVLFWVITVTNTHLNTNTSQYITRTVEQGTQEFGSSTRCENAKAKLIAETQGLNVRTWCMAK